MRALLLLLALAGCNAAVPAGDADSADTEDGRIDCRPAGEADFSRACMVERSGDELTLRKPDGGFRRLLVARDGRGVVAADGAEPAVVTLLPDRRIEVAIGGDAFRLPATVRPR